MTGEASPATTRTAAVPFQAHVELLRSFVARRSEIVERIQGLLNAQRKPPHYLQDTAAIARTFADCFFTGPAIRPEQRALERQLDEAHHAAGFKPRKTPGHHNDLVDAAELASRAFLMWQRTRWPGYDGRVRYAHTLFNLYLLRRLMLLAMRIWDEGSPRERLLQVQGVLDELVKTTPPDLPVYLRDARWLFALAQSPTTDELHAYFHVAERIAATLDEADRVAIASASVRMAGGHLRSQLRHVSTQNNVALDDRALVLSTRKSNALDLATLVQALVPLLEAYERAIHKQDAAQRLALADAILQGISPDPELFLNRLDLLGPYSMIEYLFIATDADGRAAYTPTGERHLRLLDEYAQRLARAAAALDEDCPRFRPSAGGYSPYGVLYGYSSLLLEHMGLKATQLDAVARFGLEDVFVAGDADNLAWVAGWRKLPHVPREVAKLFEYPQQFAEDVFARIERALHERVRADGAGYGDRAAVRTGRLLIMTQGSGGTPAASIPELPSEHVVSSDRQLVAARKAVAQDEAALLHSRTEGEFLVSYETPGGWAALSKDILTDIVGAGRDVRISGLPREAAAVLEAMCPKLVGTG